MIAGGFRYSSFLLMVFLICSQFLDGRDRGTGMAWAQGKPVAVRIVRARRETIHRTTTQPANVHAYYSAEIHARVSGYLRELNVDIGDVVKAGEPLGVIDVPEMLIKHERHRAMIRKLRADETRLRVQVEVAEAQLEAEQASFEQVSSELGKVQAKRDADHSEYERFEILFKDKAVTERLLEEARSRDKSSQAAVQAARSAVTSAKARVQVSFAQRKSAEAGVTVAAADIEVAEREAEGIQTLIRFATLRAPFDGVVTQRNVDPGDLVRSTSSDSSPPLFTIARVDKFRLRIAVPERDAPFVDVGDAAEFSPRAIPRQSFAGKVTRLARSIDPKTGTMDIEVELQAPDGKLFPGMFGTVTIHLQALPDSLVLDAGTVRFDEVGNGYVYVVEGNKVKIVEVTCAWDDGKQIVIADGLRGHEQIVGGMHGRLKDGQIVRVIEE